MERLARALLLALAVASVYVGAWALVSPASFFSSFPGAGRAWTGAIGPYNEHLVRDVGAFNLVLAALFTWSAVTMDRRLVTASCLTSLLFAVPHLIFHALNLHGFEAADAVGQMAALSLAVVAPLVVVGLTRARG